MEESPRTRRLRRTAASEPSSHPGSRSPPERVSPDGPLVVTNVDDPPRAPAREPVEEQPPAAVSAPGVIVGVGNAVSSASPRARDGLSPIISSTSTTGGGGGSTKVPSFLGGGFTSKNGAQHLPRLLFGAPSPRNSARVALGSVARPEQTVSEALVNHYAPYTVASSSPSGRSPPPSGAAGPRSPGDHSTGPSLVEGRLSSGAGSAGPTSYREKIDPAQRRAYNSDPRWTKGGYARRSAATVEKVSSPQKVARALAEGERAAARGRTSVVGGAVGGPGGAPTPRGRAGDNAISTTNQSYGSIANDWLVVENMP